VFSSLDRIDIVVKAGPDGPERYVQTDHRTAEEVARDPALSTLFALVRVLNPKRTVPPGSPEPAVVYAAAHRPPEFLRQAIRAAGGLLTVGESTRPDPDDSPPPALEEVVAVAFAALARTVAAEFGVEPDLEGLGTVEETLAEAAGEPGEDATVYWSAVMKLGGLAGELIRAANGGQWVLSNTGALPLALATRFQGRPATAYVLDKAIKRFAGGEEDSLVSLVRVIRGQP
jgi:hypothetical protein